jgi:hypothetical protein
VRTGREGICTPPRQRRVEPALAALAVGAGILTGTGEVGAGIADVARGSGAVDEKTAEEAKQGMRIANDRVAASALLATSPENAENIGKVAGGALAVHGIAEAAEPRVVEELNKLLNAHDIYSGYEGAKELLKGTGAYISEHADELYRYF